MDSGNSGSMQSSSGGEDEYDSRADSYISAFFNPPPHNHHHHQTQQSSSSSSTSVFDPLSNLFDPLSRSAQPPPPPPPFSNQNSLLDMVWSKTLRSEPDLGGFTASSSSQSRVVAFNSNMQIPHRPDINSPQGTVPINNDPSPTTTTANMVRNPKKRSRASRRAPTTVLTTDTTNFRAMVQEFTGIPAPPFTSSPFPRTTIRLDSFGSSSSPPPYPLRPFAQKLQPLHPSFLSSSPSSSFSSSSSTTCPSIADHVINMQFQNPLFNFQSPLLNQALPKYNPLSNSVILGTKQYDQSLQINQSFQNIASSSSDAVLARRDINNGDPGWGGDGMGSSEGDRQGLFRSINGSYNDSQRVVNSNGKLNYLGGSGSSSSDFHGDKGTENVVTRTSEGMVESLICSSD